MPTKPKAAAKNTKAAKTTTKKAAAAKPAKMPPRPAKQQSPSRARPAKKEIVPGSLYCGNYRGEHAVIEAVSAVNSNGLFDGRRWYRGQERAVQAFEAASFKIEREVTRAEAHNLSLNPKYYG